ncbi:MAG TPA: transglutaminase family protein [Accumulibacter sp.]|nr:transglutaminase family protein [Accumulibacter sp.]HMX23208.1 transglutaminase family protein [Accumulibacter sp.]HMY07724.1 transglutaminase family protein [Accumulibacter sp.]HNC19088.1 transglutaminase family protein [Accumulibacter sp.]HND81546.1 transglutaminase family protein [Accumulibacter sp.]
MIPSPARYHLIHETSYHYASPVSLSRQLLHLTPRESRWQRLLRHDILVSPTPTGERQREDCFGNTVRELTLEYPHDALIVRAESIVEVLPHLPATAQAALAQASAGDTGYLDDSPPWEAVRNALAYGAHPICVEANRYQFESTYVRVKHQFAAYAATSFTPGRPVLAAAQALMSRIHNEFAFDPEATTVATPVSTVLAEKKGVCQDFAHLMLSCLRSQGLAARYVSGYLLTQPPPGQPRLVGADASHAWVSVFCPELEGGRWVDFDPTNNLLPDTQHITLAWGRDFADVSPLRGVILGGDAHQPEVAVTVTPIA